MAVGSGRWCVVASTLSLVLWSVALQAGLIPGVPIAQACKAGHALPMFNLNHSFLFYMFLSEFWVSDSEELLTSRLYCRISIYFAELSWICTYTESVYDFLEKNSRWTWTFSAAHFELATYWCPSRRKLCMTHSTLSKIIHHSCFRHFVLKRCLFKRIDRDASCDWTSETIIEVYT